MLGEHPQMYGFPELHLFIGATVQEVIDRELGRVGGYSYAGPPGVLRSLAELHDSVQTAGSIVRASVWLHERGNWSTKALLDYLFRKVSPRIAVEKSPPTALRVQFIERAYTYYPDAFFIHLTRHPLPNRDSLREFVKGREQKKRGSHGEDEVDNRQQRVDKLISWHFMHDNILRFTSTLPSGQTMRIKGEDILSYPDIFLPQIAEWMGLRTDREAIEAMKHPENSPYARVGPPMARGGNDGKFMRSPKLRRGKIKQPSLEAFLKENPDLQWVSSSVIGKMEQTPLRMASGGEIQEHFSELSALLGYW